MYFCIYPNGIRCNKPQNLRSHLMELTKHLDNVTNKVIDDLQGTLCGSDKISIAAASFSIYAYEAMKEELEAIDELRFIFTSPTFNQERTPKQKREFERNL